MFFFGEIAKPKLRRVLKNLRNNSKILTSRSESFAVFHKTLKNSRNSKGAKSKLRRLSQKLKNYRNSKGAKSKLRRPKWDKEIWKQQK